MNNHSQEYRITTDDIVYGSPGYIMPLSVNFSPNAKQLTYLFPDSTGKRQLFCIDVDKISWETGNISSYKLIDSSNSDEKLSLEEELRRERMRLFTEGISSYEWANEFDNRSHQLMLIPLGSKLYLYNDSVAKVYDRCKLIYDGELGSAIDPHLSPDGNYVAFVINNDLYLQSLLTSDSPSPERLTCDGSFAGRSSGVADYIAQEEMDRYRGFWWSPDSQFIVYTRNDESHIPLYTIHHQSDEDPTHSETHRYPFAGKANPKVEVALIVIHQLTAGSKILTVVDQDDTRFHTLPITSPSAVVEQDVNKVEFYVCRVGWWPDGSIMIQVQNRHQNVLQLLRVDVITGERLVLLEETTSAPEDTANNNRNYLNLHDLCWPLSAGYVPPVTVLANCDEKEVNPGDFYFLWGSERQTGFMQLYFYRYVAGTRKQAICLSKKDSIGLQGEYVVDSILAVDESQHMVYYQGNYSNPTECHAYCSSFLPNHHNTGSHWMLTQHCPGWHNVTINTKHHLMVDIHQSLHQPVVMRLHAFSPTTGQILHTLDLYDMLNVDKRCVTNPFLLPSLVRPEIHRLTTTTTSTSKLIKNEVTMEQLDLYTAIYLPKGVKLSDYLNQQKNNNSNQLEALPSFPAIVSVYGGPHVQRVQNHWLLTADLRTQRFVQQGYVVIKCDNRGSARRGKCFESAVYGTLGVKELADQITAVRYYLSLGLLSPGRIGIVGWSYGGFMSAYALCGQKEPVFASAIAGAPVTFWAGYDTHYTERYMGLPQENSQGYEVTSNLLAQAQALQGNLLLIHGVIDENVHLRHTTRFIQALMEARKHYELILLPRSRHGPQLLSDKVYVEERMSEFFHRTLKTGDSNNNSTNNSTSRKRANSNGKEAEPQVLQCVVVAR